MNKEIKKVLVSACLLGEKCRYDGAGKPCGNVINYLKDKQIFKVCPEVMGGLDTPRNPAEIIGDRIVSSVGVDVTMQYHKGANIALEIAKREGVDLCILKSRSPSCGSGEIYDGTFSGTLKGGNGCTSQLLKENGFEVVSELDI
ncbi:MAG: DUF523 domain-containing protein [Bacillota bacterium]